MNIKFRSEKHQNIFNQLLNKCVRQDNYHLAMMYLLALIISINQNDISLSYSCFDFEDDHIKKSCLDADWQTGITVKITRLAFNLWNGYSEKCNVDDIFGTSLDKYFFESIKLRFS